MPKRKPLELRMQINQERQCPECTKYVASHNMAFTPSMLKQRLAKDGHWWHPSQHGRQLHRLATMTKPRPIIRPGLNEQIREVRKAAKLTQRELAHAMGCSQAFVQGLESGKKTPNLRHLLAIANATRHSFTSDAGTVVFAD